MKYGRKEKRRSVIGEIIPAQNDATIGLLLRGGPFSWVQTLNNTVSGITVLGYVGRSGFQPDTSPSEVSRPWQAKIPQAEK
jgi:hypothetical protein